MNFPSIQTIKILSLLNGKRLIQTLPWLVFFIFIFLVCSHKVPPRGGPEDKTPPTVIRHFPSADSVGITRLDYLEVEFSEPIRTSTLIGNYWIMPPLKNDFSVKWKGNKKVRFYFKDTLEKNQTYVFTLSPNVRDLRNNGLTRPFQLAFSTGSKLDRGSIQGKIYADQKQREVYVYAYRIDPAQNLDSLFYSRPRYYTQIDADGSYRLNYLSLKKYRLIAFVDQNYDRLYTIESDVVGLPFRDVELDSLYSNFIQMNFYLFQEDTTPPAIKNIDTLSNRHIKVTLSEQIKLRDLFKVSLIDSLSGEDVMPLAWSVEAGQSDQLQVFFPELPAKRRMILQLQGLSDMAGNEPKPNFSRRSFFSAARSDTSSPVWRKITPARNEREVVFSAPVVATFSVPVDTMSYKKSLKVFDPDSSLLDGRFDFQNLLSPAFYPVQNLLSNTTYRVELSLASLQDWWQRAFSDTLIRQEFTTQDLANTGEIAGLVHCPDFAETPAIIEVNPVRGQQVYRALSRPDGSYQVDYLPEGQYLIKAIVDRNRNGIWDRGSTIPWQFAEPFLVKADTIRIRKRWTTQGIDFEFTFQEREK